VDNKARSDPRQRASIRVRYFQAPVLGTAPTLDEMRAWCAAAGSVQQRNALTRGHRFLADSDATRHGAARQNPSRLTCVHDLEEAKTRGNWLPGLRINTGRNLSQQAPEVRRQDVDACEALKGHVSGGDL